MSRPEGADLQRVDSYQWPKGHIGHLGDGQLKTLTNFKKLCQEKGYYRPGDKDTLPSHDDETLLRYLRARKFIPADAYTQFKETEDWRKENEIDKIYETIDVHEYHASSRLYPQWTGRRDKRGIPFYVYEVGSLNSKDITANSNDKNRPKDGPFATSKVPVRLLKLFALYENLLRFALPLCSTVPDRGNLETPISQSNNIVDISRVGLTTFWNLKNHMQDASKLATAHYPETLDRIFIVGAPSFFPTVWGWIKKWFDPITVSKIFILSPANTLSTLEQFIDKDLIPKKYGGNLEWEFGDLPSLDPVIAKQFTWHEEFMLKGSRSLPPGPIRFEHDDKGDLVMVAVGTEDGKQRHLKLGTMHPDANVALLDIGISRTIGRASPAASAATTPDTTTATTPAPSSEAATATTGPAPEAAASPAPPLTTVATPTDSEKAPTTDATPTGTAEVPFHNPEDRTGTSHTRFLQQANTHAESIVAHGTPEVKTDGQGVSHAVMEPRTVGQAPKDTPLVDETTPAPTLMEKAGAAAGTAQEYATSGVTAVLAAVGLADKKTEAKKPEEDAEGKPHLADQLEDHQVEEMLRAKMMTGPAGVEGASGK